jgi:hypothetical protein
MENKITSKARLENSKKDLFSEMFCLIDVMTFQLSFIAKLISVVVSI